MATVKLSKTTNLVVGLIALSIFIGGISQSINYISLNRRAGIVQTAQLTHNVHSDYYNTTYDGIDYTVRLDDGRVVSFETTCGGGDRGGRYYSCTTGNMYNPDNRVTLVEDPVGVFQLSNTVTAVEYPVLTTLALVVLIFNVVGFIKKSRRR